MSNREYDYLFKLVIIGNSSVGKSSILLRFADDQFNESYLTTIGVDFRFKTLQIDGKNVKLQIWDTAGQERFRTITNAYYKGADGIVIVYDQTSQPTFDDIEKFWLNEIESYADKTVELLLLGNKADLDEKKKVDSEKAQAYAQARKMDFFETSAKTAEYVDQAFISISKKLMLKRDQQLNEKRSQRKKNRQQEKKSDSRQQQQNEPVGGESDTEQEIKQNQKLQTQSKEQESSYQKLSQQCNC